MTDATDWVGALTTIPQPQGALVPLPQAQPGTLVFIGDIVTGSQLDFSRSPDSGLIPLIGD